ncbi:four-carbon acid sugar kinase family protein [Kocuria rosea]|uniref:Four-carbon acid sugar kinase family protein n=1 Tax=Kocuria rosea TaxID=1275 RepID=A0A4R5Y1A8_KOCRO|nr:four-carbon acid sugar kinase family protein [Kocuria rosea]TDL38123.1 four-carbon acid sugar kinase family protein [Kocuria rosea]
MALFSFVADDLTGASDVLSQAHRYGLEAVLVMGDAPLPADADVVGIAGPARSLAGAAFDTRVRADLARLAATPSEVLLYKVCSTFDSSPTTGSIGRGIELLHDRFPDHGPISVAPAQPGFGRYTAFSDHYATHAGQVHRLDRHPVMSSHPSTPMHEADLRQVLATQLNDGVPVGSIHLPAYDTGAFPETWAQQRAGTGMSAFVVDAVSDAHLDALAAALRQDAQVSSPAIVVGSGGIMAALARTVTSTETLSRPLPSASGPVLAVSASASSVTAAQLQDAVDHGWIDVPVDPALLQGPDPDQHAVLAEQVSSALGAGHHVVVHTTRGSNDPRYAATGPLDAAYVGELLGRIAAAMATAGLTRDIAVLGGDTSSHALTAMGVRELRVTDQFVTAAPICRADDDAAVAGCRLVLKGGQVGPTDLLRRFAGDTTTSPTTESVNHRKATPCEQ